MGEHVVTYEQVVKTTKTVRIVLQHCPFCGGAAEFRIGGNYNRKLDCRMGVGVRCTECKVLTPIKEGGECPEMRAAELWNRRVEL